MKLWPSILKQQLAHAEGGYTCRSLLLLSLERSVQSQLQLKPKEAVEAGDKDRQRMRNGDYLDEEVQIKDTKRRGKKQMYIKTSTWMESMFYKSSRVKSVTRE